MSLDATLEIDDNLVETRNTAPGGKPEYLRDKKKLYIDLPATKSQMHFDDFPEVLTIESVINGNIIFEESFYFPADDLNFLRDDYLVQDYKSLIGMKVYANLVERLPTEYSRTTCTYYSIDKERTAKSFIKFIKKHPEAIDTDFLESFLLKKEKETKPTRKMIKKSEKIISKELNKLEKHKQEISAVHKEEKKARKLLKIAAKHKI